LQNRALFAGIEGKRAQRECRRLLAREYARELVQFRRAILQRAALRGGNHRNSAASGSDFRSRSQAAAATLAQAGDRAMTVFVYVNTSKQIGDKDHIKVFANVDAAEKWFEENDPEGVAFEYEVLE
jgi:hypothetical protein